jgi:ribonuclease J
MALNRVETSVFALGGLGEVGKNMYCVEHDNTLIIIDSGVKFPESDFPGIDYVIPDFSYLVQNSTKIKALIITHGHEDHIGSIPFLVQRVNIPVIYAPRLAAALIRHKLEEHRVTNRVKIIEIDGATQMKFGDLKVEFFDTTHSIPDTLGLIIDTPNGRILTTGDFKIDLTPIGQPLDFHKVARFGAEGVTLMLSDSTNIEAEGLSLSESKVVGSINNIFKETENRLMVATFSSNIHRIQQIVEAAVAFKRKIVIFGRSMEKTVMIGRKYGYIRCPDSSIIQPENIRNYKNEELLILCTGSQGEPLAALSRIANDVHKYIKIIPGDTVVFSSSPIPGNTQSVNRVVNALFRRGANVLTNSVLTDIHASGHGNKEELKLMLTLVKPKFFMPMHGEYRMLKLHADLAMELGIKKENTFVLANGDVINMLNGECKLGKRVETDDIYVDGKDSSGLSTSVIRDRKILSTDGVVSVLISMDSRENKLLTRPIVVSRGFMHMVESQTFTRDASKIVEAALVELFKGKVNFSSIKNTIRSSVSSFIYDKTNRNPMVIPVIMNKLGDDAALQAETAVENLKRRSKRPEADKA